MSGGYPEESSVWSIVGNTRKSSQEGTNMSTRLILLCETRRDTDTAMRPSDVPKLPPGDGCGGQGK